MLVLRDRQLERLFQTALTQLAQSRDLTEWNPSTPPGSRIDSPSSCAPPPTSAPGWQEKPSPTAPGNSKTDTPTGSTSYSPRYLPRPMQPHRHHPWRSCHHGFQRRHADQYQKPPPFI